MYFSRYISVRVILCENAEGSVRVWDLDDRVRERGVREFGRDISVRGERDEDDSDDDNFGEKRGRDATDGRRRKRRRW